MELRKQQKQAIEFIENKRVSLIEASVGLGKTFLTLYFIKENVSRSFVILVHKKAMIKQWQDESIKVFGEILENMEIYAYTTELPKNIECDCLVIDEYHFLKSVSKRWRNAKRIKWSKTIWLTATPTDSQIDWYAYLKFMGMVTNKEQFYKRYEAYGHNAMIPNIRYPKYISYQKTKMFEMDGLNEEKLEEDLSRFRLTLIANDVLKNINHTYLNCSPVPKMDYLDMRYTLHEKTKEKKLKWIKENISKGIILVNYNIEKEYLEQNLNDNYWIINYKEASLTGTDGLQHKYNNMIFWTPIPSKLRLIQAIGRIDRTGQKEKVRIVTFVSNNYEQRLWEKTLNK